MDTVAETGTGEHWVNYLASSSVTARGADERLALVGNIGDHNEVRWVVIGQSDEGWWLRGTSECLGSGLDAPPSFDVPPDLLDFDDDGRQEVLGHHSRERGERAISFDTLYRWDGHALASVWAAPTVVDHATADDQDVLHLYQAEWEWADLDGEGLDEILLHERVAFDRRGERGCVADDVPCTGEENGERAFRWDGEAFRPYAPDGPDAAFAYVASGDVWLWRNHAARPLGVEHVREIQWSPDGRRVAWWAQPPLGSGGASACQSVVLGIYDVTTGGQREFALQDSPVALDWASDVLLAYALPDRPPALLDLRTGQRAPLPAAALGAWSPDGSRIAYERDGSLYVYDLAACQERALVVAPPEGGSADLTVLPDLAWSPRGDWIACYLSNHDFTWVGLVASDLSAPLSALDLLETFGGRQAPGIQFAWSSDGSRLAVLTADPRLAERPTVLYLAEVPHGGEDPVGLPEWQQVLQLEAEPQTGGPAWSPDGERLTLAVGAELWEVTAAGEATLRHRFSFPAPGWKTLEWAPDGSGVLVGLESVDQGRLYWFPADGDDAVLLLADSLGSAHWAPRPVEARGYPSQRPSMVLVEYVGYKPRLHFVAGDGSETVVRTRRADRDTPFQIGGGRVYYHKYYADGRRVRTLRVPRALADCQPPLASPDGTRLAWLCDSGPPGMGALMDGTAAVHFRLVVTDWRGRRMREVWRHVETGSGCRSMRLMGWRMDGEVIYLSRSKYAVAWAYFEYNPGILALDVDTGQVTQIGDLDGVHDGLVSPDGAWLAQSRVGEWPDQGVITVSLRSLVGPAERAIGCAPGAIAAGDFSFSPCNAWLAWRERVEAPGGPRLLIRALHLPDGEPLTVYEDAENVAPRIGGWLRRDELVLVYPLREDGTGEYSTLVTLPATGPGVFFSPFVFLGVSGERPCWRGTSSTASSSPHVELKHPAGGLNRSKAGSQPVLGDVGWLSICDPQSAISNLQLP